MKTSSETRNRYQPGPAGNARVRRDGDRWTLVFVRELGHPPGKVWSALTEPSQLVEWAPFDPDRDLGSIGPVALTMVGGPSDEVLKGEVRHADPPRLLEYTWGDDVLRWELEEIDSGTRLTLSHTTGDRTWLPKVAAGWHMCLDVVERALAGHPIARIVAHDAKKHGWERLNAEYAERFGIENTGWPEQFSE